jgi:hypothetical protein
MVIQPEGNGYVGRIVNPGSRGPSFNGYIWYFFHYPDTPDEAKIINYKSHYKIPKKGGGYRTLEDKFVSVSWVDFQYPEKGFRLPTDAGLLKKPR